MNADLNMRRMDTMWRFGNARGACRRINLSKRQGTGYPHELSYVYRVREEDIEIRV